MCSWLASIEVSRYSLFSIDSTPIEDRCFPQVVASEEGEEGLINEEQVVYLIRFENVVDGRIVRYAKLGECRRVFSEHLIKMDFVRAKETDFVSTAPWQRERWLRGAVLKAFDTADRQLRARPGEGPVIAMYAGHVVIG